ncbi:DUF2145 domain-containing protein [Pseudoalteromonas sp. MMG005]|uniref:DUF2145 domain-containing protein n=1 Tax=Pseudoalteromonas sp. MMG005 TaxID=2822682 RepID=UPI001B3A27B9|nr:DUF2145 domain-containing protein [Pseudoalteromonas sp. MMG005]MBQ4848424.1 DUF2145 domain-containing protein [Pseudoalteromonas sp. MMG005]
MTTRLAITFLILLYHGSTYAGSTQTKHTRFDANTIALFAKDVEKYAAKNGAHSFIIARRGQPKNKLPAGFQFTHTAIAVYSQIQLDSGESVKGYAIHNLYQEQTDANKSLLVTDYPVDFFWGADSLTAGIAIPTIELQTRLIAAIQSGVNKSLHNPHYSLIANPFNNAYQNCTEHTLNVINAALYQTDNMARLKANAKAYFQATPVKVSRIKLALGNWFADGVTTKDHDKIIQTASFTSIAQYLQEFGLLKSAVIFEHKKNAMPLFN